MCKCLLQDPFKRHRCSRHNETNEALTSHLQILQCIGSPCTAWRLPAYSFQALGPRSLSVYGLTMTTRRGGRSQRLRSTSGTAHAPWLTEAPSSAPACRQLRMRRRQVALGGRKGSSRRRGRRGCGCLVRVGFADIMPGIVELPTLEDLKVEEVRLVREAGKRGLRLKFPGPGPSPAFIQRTLGPGPLPQPPTQTGQPPGRPFPRSGSRHSARSGS